MSEYQTTMLPGEQEKIDAAQAALDKDPHAPRELSVRVRIHRHHEYPKMVYLGKKTMLVNSDDEEQAAIANGYGPHVPEVAKEE